MEYAQFKGLPYIWNPTCGGELANHESVAEYGLKDHNERKQTQTKQLIKDVGA